MTPTNPLIRTLRYMATVVALPAVVVAAWWIAAAALASSVFPTPLAAVQGLIADFGREEYRDAIVATVGQFALALVLAVILGGVLGFVLGFSKFWASVFELPLAALYAVPKVALYPIFIIVFGIAWQSGVAFAYVHGVIPMALLVMTATAALDKGLLLLADSLVLSWPARMTKVIIPALLPPLVTAIRTTFGLTMLGLLLAGMISAPYGLGHELVLNITNVRVDRTAGQLIFIIALAVIPGLLLLGLERRVTRRYAG
ncbi:ABC transporter permease [Microbacterium album]|uniref:ABC transporter n=1 Tax=Microbacterium album TaxID=2053191 RepID=A0A917IJ50_9MICO|nr:ABC transporter permease subunit [Microbacterium album]GGH51663.1 ABC transporter [Microbacterium album]